MRLRRMLAVWAAKLTEKISVHIFHRQGVTWAGKIALQICPSILEKSLAGRVKKRYLYCVWNEWKDDDKQYALRGASKRRVSGCLQSHGL